MEPINKLRIAIASDHAGYELKQKIIVYLTNYKVLKLKDFGCFSTESCDYPDFAHPLSTAVENGEFDFGITICGSGNGINMTANKHKGIRSALCWLPELGSLARRHNNANVLALPARFISEKTAYEIVEAFFTANFEGGRHQHRVEKITQF